MLAIGPSMMGLLFLIAGITTCYSLRRRSYHEYLTERTTKLLIPFFAGLFLVIPCMYYINSLGQGNSNGFFSLLVSFLTDITSIQKCQHLWFILCLFIVSVVALILIVPARRKSFAIPPEKITIPGILLLLIPCLLLGRICDFGASLTLSGAFIIFLFGYFFFVDDAVREKLVAKRWLFLSVFVTLTIGNIILYMHGYQTGYWIANYKVAWFSPYYGMATQWAGILAMISLGIKYLEFHNGFTEYMSEASFAIYIFHYPCLLAGAYIFAPLVQIQVMQYLAIIVAGFVFCIALYEVIRRIPGLRFLFGIRKRKCR
jgi:hypothetical protein